ncbi:hypothetical protein D9613_010308 [Agrocybe pediades]|uniref:Rad60/SUMO-like domain-containing protein n=1 Tax=Agrocybe pediades TaxID=84607 RepID=A0A8H4VI48_9AGAR|nr:hypothetical protein D9613_010308 [Agrocybe pediades]
MTEIPEEMWEDVVGAFRSVTIVTVEGRAFLPSPSVEPQAPVETNKVNLRVVHEGYEAAFKVRKGIKFLKIMESFALRLGKCFDDYYFCYDGSVLSPEDTPASKNMENGDQIDVLRRQIRGKPVIYIFSPSPIEASVKLSLAPQWDFSAIYPVVPIEKPIGQAHHQEITWRIRAQPNGSEGPQALGSTEGSVEAFNPNATILNDDNSVVLPVSEVTPYLDRALHALGLHTEARTSFITYWLPSILKHKNIAFRFVPQASYEQAAPLTVSPTPDIVSRVFMVFQGVSDEEVPQWTKATAKVEEDVSFWEDVVGIDRN